MRIHYYFNTRGLLCSLALSIMCCNSFFVWFRKASTDDTNCRFVLKMKFYVPKCDVIALTFLYLRLKCSLFGKSAFLDGYLLTIFTVADDKYNHHEMCRYYRLRCWPKLLLLYWYSTYHGSLSPPYFTQKYWIVDFLFPILVLYTPNWDLIS